MIGDIDLAATSTEKLKLLHPELLQDPAFFDSHHPMHDRAVAVASEILQEICRREPAANPFADLQEPPSGAQGEGMPDRRSELTSEIDKLVSSEPYQDRSHADYYKTFTEVTNLSKELASLDGGDAA